MFPVEDEQIKKEVMHILDIQMKDNVKASILQADGTYTKPDKRGKTLVNSQEYSAGSERKERKNRKNRKTAGCLCRQNRWNRFGRTRTWARERPLR